MNLLKLRTLLILAVVFLSYSATANADGLTFSNLVALQNNRVTQVDLFSNPQVNLLGSQINFFITIDGTLPPSGDILRLTFTEVGQAPVVKEIQIPIFPGLTLPYIQQFDFSPLNPTTQGTPTTFTVDILGSSPDFVIPSGPNQGNQVDSYTFTFNAASPVPEPVTSGFFLLGLSAIIARARRYTA